MEEEEEDVAHAPIVRGTNLLPLLRSSLPSGASSLTFPRLMASICFFFHYRCTPLVRRFTATDWAEFFWTECAAAPTRFTHSLRSPPPVLSSKMTPTWTTCCSLCRGTLLGRNLNPSTDMMSLLCSSLKPARAAHWLTACCLFFSTEPGSKFFVVRKHGDAKHKLPRRGDLSINWRVLTHA